MLGHSAAVLFWWLFISKPSENNRIQVTCCLLTAGDPRGREKRGLFLTCCTTMVCPVWPLTVQLILIKVLMAAVLNVPVPPYSWYYHAHACNRVLPQTTELAMATFRPRGSHAIDRLSSLITMTMLVIDITTLILTVAHPLLAKEKDIGICMAKACTFCGVLVLLVYCHWLSTGSPVTVSSLTP
jgi:hypothetical protein